MKLSRRELIMTIFMVWVIIGAFYYYFIYSPGKEKLEMLRQSNNQLETQKTGHKAVSAVNMVDTALMEYKQVLEKMPEQPFLPEYLDLVAEAADQSDTELSAINYGQKNNQNSENVAGESDNAGKKVNKPVPYQLLPAEFEIRGNYYQIKSFIEEIENSSRLIAVNKVSILAMEVKQEQQSEITEPASDQALSSDAEAADQTLNPAVTNVVKPRLVGSALYDPDNLIMTIQLTAFYDTRSIKGQSGVAAPLVPPSESKENPYKK